MKKNKLIFASEIKAILKFEEFDKEIEKKVEVKEMNAVLNRAAILQAMLVEIKTSRSIPQAYCIMEY